MQRETSPGQLWNKEVKIIFFENPFLISVCQKPDTGSLINPKTGKGAREPSVNMTLHFATLFQATVWQGVWEDNSLFNMHLTFPTPDNPRPDNSNYVYIFSHRRKKAIARLAGLCMFP